MQCQGLSSLDAEICGFHDVSVPVFKFTVHLGSKADVLLQTFMCGKVVSLQI